MTTRFTDAKITGGGLYEFGPLYCSFSFEKEQYKSCDEFDVGNYDSNGIAYKRDKYWNKTATIPSQARVLLLSGKRDHQAPNKYAEGRIEREEERINCKVFTSYVRNGRNLKRLDKSCVAEIPAFNLDIPDVYLTSYFGTDEAYDGVLNSSLFPNWKVGINTNEN
ncbi:Serine protease [Phytophthora megakarya]|uniref:Serine protease n=1 Tax=Phytophthora megakarya TaxID=4795 RepID=A0A225WBM5_9STRA|nr:Serine protease [Phytophthora megakarya]